MIDKRLEARNKAAFIADGANFSIGGAFLEANTVLPTFVSTLTDSPFLIGLVSTVRSFGYLVPQIFVAGFIERLPVKKPFMMKAGWVMRMAAILMASSALIAAKNQILALTVFYIGLSALALGDGFSGLPWMDIVARTVQPQTRGGLFGTMQALGGIGAFLSGFVVRSLLQNCERYPSNYFTVMALGALFLMVSLVAMHFIIDPGGNKQSHHTSMSEYLRRLPESVKQNPTFSRVLTVRILVGGLYLALPFFAIHAQSDLGFPKSIVGLFISAQMMGTVVGGPLWGYLGDKHGPFWVVRIVALATGLTGVMALLSRVTFLMNWAYLTYTIYFLLYFFLGTSLGGTWIGFSNYVIDIASDNQTASFLGILNTVAGPLTLLTLVGGWILKTVGYGYLFGVMVSISGIACVTAWRLPDSRTCRPNPMEFSPKA